MYGRVSLLKYSLSLSAAAEIMPACRSAAVRLGASCASVCLCVCVCEGEGAWGAHVSQTRQGEGQAGRQAGWQDTAELSGEAHSICAFGFLKNALKAHRGGKERGKDCWRAGDWAGSSSNNG